MSASSVLVKLATACIGLFSFLFTVLAIALFEWETLTPCEHLKWTPCYSGFQCSLLQVPLDYAAPSKGSASIAIVRLPSNSSNSEYRGPLLFNPGGPGENGVDAVVEFGAEFATIFGPEFDIIISFFETDAERNLWMPVTPTIMFPSLNASSDAVPRQWARAQLLGQLASLRDPQSHLQHMTTDNVARDMLRITEAFGWDKLQFWGISYGSVLGSTFATLFPDKVGRLVIDGILDADAWYSTNLTSELTDTDKTLQTFFDGCTAAGPENCEFFAPSAAEISANLTALTSLIQSQPIPVLTNTSYGIVDYTFLRNVLFDALGSPYGAFAQLAQGLASLAGGNATPIYAPTAVPPFECPTNATAPPFHDNAFEAQVAISWGDGAPVSDSIAQLRQFYSAGATLSSFADLVSIGRVNCAAELTPSLKVGGKFIAKAASKGSPVGAANTSFPLLIIGNTADPITPIRGAIKTAASFPGSALLTQDSPGHTSMTAPSLCTWGYLREYFQNGTLPAPGTVCAVDAELFPSAAGKTSAKRSGDEEDITDARRAVGDVVRRMVSRCFRRLV
ncbi:TAP-like protein-domain-containing protein [Mycena latifolia]|nr:TAP-like protein-domain-containing protein [Mycena latifolia]